MILTVGSTCTKYHTDTDTHTHIHRHTQPPIHTDTDTHIHVHRHIYTQTQTHTYMYTDTHIHVHRHTHTCTQTHIHTDTQTHTYTDTYTHRHRHIHTCTQTHIHTDTHIHVHRPVFLISSYGAPLAQRASYLALHIFLFGPVVQLIMIMLSLTALSLSKLAQDVFSMAHTLTIFEPICPKLQNLSKTLTQTHTCIHTDTQT